MSDILARQLGQWLAERLGQPFIIENRPGAGSNLGTEVVVRAPPDGYTLLEFTSANAFNATLYEKLNFNFIRDIAPVAGLARFHYVMDVNPLLPIKTVPEFIAYAKANPGKLSMASNGIGTGSHIAGELFKRMAGVDIAHVPYRGAAQALPDLLGGQVQVMFDATASSIEHIRTGRLRALAVTSAACLDALPDVPALGEFLTGYEASSTNGVGVPSGTPTDIVGKLNTAINAGLADPNIRAKFADLGLTVLVASPAELKKLIANETEKWGKVIRFSGARPE